MKGMKCRIHKCHACCCNSVPFAENELERFKDKIVRPVVDTMPLGKAILPSTTKLHDRLDLLANDLLNNPCPFLRHDYKCNIYEHRPEVCRLFGEIKELPCKYIKK